MGKPFCLPRFSGGFSLSKKHFPPFRSPKSRQNRPCTAPRGNHKTYMSPDAFHISLDKGIFVTEQKIRQRSAYRNDTANRQNDQLSFCPQHKDFRMRLNPHRMNDQKTFQPKALLIEKYGCFVNRLYSFILQNLPPNCKEKLQ